MTNQEAHLAIAIEQTKLFLLRDVPLNELPTSKRMRDIVGRYRLGALNVAESLQYFESFYEELREIALTNIELCDALLEINTDL